MVSRHLRIPQLLQLGLGLTIIIGVSVYFQGYSPFIGLLENSILILSWYRTAGLLTIIGWVAVGLLSGLLQRDSPKAINTTIWVLVILWIADVIVRINSGLLDFPLVSEQKYAILLGLIEYLPWFVTAPLSSFFFSRGVSKFFPTKSKHLISQTFSPRVCKHCQTSYNSDPSYCYVCGNLFHPHTSEISGTSTKEP